MDAPSESPITSVRPAAPNVKPGEPFCGNCGYSLVGATETAVCPECGKPLVEVLMRGRAAWQAQGKRYRSEATLFGLPVIDIAYGPDGDDQFGSARGIIALGNRATGFLAFGGVARGAVAFGGVAMGGVAFGGASVGVVAAGGAAAGLFAAGGMAVGGIATGGGAAGVIAQGGGAVGLYARGGGVAGLHTVGPRGPSSPHAAQVFDNVSWLIGTPNSQLSILLPIAHMTVVTVVLTAAIGLLALYGHRRWARGAHGS